MTPRLIRRTINRALYSHDVERLRGEREALSRRIELRREMHAEFKPLEAKLNAVTTELLALETKMGLV